MARSIKLSGAWRVHTPAILREIVNNPNTAILNIPLNILGKLLAEVADRAAQLNDDELNACMINLTLYEVADPYSKEYDAKLVARTIAKGRAAKAKRLKKKLSA